MVILLEIVYPVPQSFLKIVFKGEFRHTLWSRAPVFTCLLCAHYPVLEWHRVSFHTNPFHSQSCSCTQVTLRHPCLWLGSAHLAFLPGHGLLGRGWHMYSCPRSGENIPVTRSEEPLVLGSFFSAWKHRRGFPHKQLSPGHLLATTFPPRFSPWVSGTCGYCLFLFLDM